MTSLCSILRAFLSGGAMKNLILICALALVACERSDLPEAAVTNHEWKMLGNRCSNTDKITTIESSESPNRGLDLRSRSLFFRGFQFKDTWVFSKDHPCKVVFKGRFEVNGSELKLSYKEVTGIKEANDVCGVVVKMAVPSLQTFKFFRTATSLELNTPVTEKTKSSACPMGQQTVEVFE